MTGTKQAREATSVAVLKPRAEQLAELRWDWVVVVLQHGTDPQIKQVVLETAARTNHRLHGHGEPVDRPWIVQIAAETDCPLMTVQAVMEAADRLGAPPKRSATPQPRPERACAGPSDPREP